MNDRINAALLKSKMVLHGYTNKKLANSLGLSEQSISVKIRGIKAFTLSEAKKISELLELSEKDKIDIFLL